MLALWNRSDHTDTRKTSRIRRRGLQRSLERLEQRQLLAGDLEFSTLYPSTTGDDGVYALAADRRDGIIARFPPSAGQGYQLDYSTYFGGESYVRVEVIDEKPVLIGWTKSEDLPLRDAFQSEFGGLGDTGSLWAEGFVAQFNEDGSDLLFATYLGGNDLELTYTHVITDGKLWVGGATYSSDFPTTDGSTLQGTTDGFLTRFDLGTQPDDRPLLTTSNITLAEGNDATTEATFTFTLAESLNEDVSFDYITATGSAVPGEDYVSISGSLTIAAGETVGIVAELV